MSGFERRRSSPCRIGMLAGRYTRALTNARIERLPEGRDADVRVYHCAACHHEMRLTVWAALV